MVIDVITEINHFVFDYFSETLRNFQAIVLYFLQQNFYQS